MLDGAIAALFSVETRRLNEQVRRNAGRFESYAFQLTHEETANLISQNATSSWGGRRKALWVFTEHGVVMAATVLKSDPAIAATGFYLRRLSRPTSRHWIEILTPIQFAPLPGNRHGGTLRGKAAKHRFWNTHERHGPRYGGENALVRDALGPAMLKTSLSPHPTGRLRHPFGATGLRQDFRDLGLARQGAPSCEARRTMPSAPGTGETAIAGIASGEPYFDRGVVTEGPSDRRRRGRRLGADRQCRQDR